MKEKLEYDLLVPLLSEIKHRYKSVIEPQDDETLVAKKGDEQICFISYDSEEEEIKITGEKGEKILKELLKIEKQNKEFFTPDNVKNMVISNISEPTLNGITTNKELFKKLNDMFKNLKIKKLHLNTTINKTNDVLKNVTMFIKPSLSVDSDSIRGYRTRTSKLIWETFPHKLKSKDDVNNLLSEGVYIKPIEGENIKPIIIKDVEIGKYYVDRNVLLLFFNPFELEKTHQFSKELPSIFSDLEESLKTLDIKKSDTNEMIKKNFIKTFMYNVDNTLKQKEREVETITSEVINFDKRIVEMERENMLNKQTIDYLKKIIQTGGSEILSEIDSLDNLPFVEKYDLSGESLDIVFKPNFLKIKNFKRETHTTDHGLRYIYVGQITASITPTGIKIKNDYPMTVGNTHTHANGDGSPCFGDGDASKKFREYRVQNKFKELGTMLWFWVNTHRDNGAYIRMGQFYDDRLKQGLPVLDEKGKPIKINDKKRIETGEQQSLEKHRNYEENQKKFDKYMEAFKK